MRIRISNILTVLTNVCLQINAKCPDINSLNTTSYFDKTDIQLNSCSKTAENSRCKFRCDHGTILLQNGKRKKYSKFQCLPDDNGGFSWKTKNRFECVINSCYEVPKQNSKYTKILESWNDGFSYLVSQKILKRKVSFNYGEANSLENGWTVAVVLKAALATGKFSALNGENLTADKTGKVFSFTSVDGYNSNLTDLWKDRIEGYTVYLKFENTGVHVENFDVEKVMVYDQKFLNTACLAENTQNVTFQLGTGGKWDSKSEIPENCSENTGFCSENKETQECDAPIQPTYEPVLPGHQCFSKHNSTSNNEPVIVASFNVQIFGDAKVNKHEVALSLVEIMSLFDLVAIQEFRDADRSGIDKFLNEYLNVTGEWAFSIGELDKVTGTTSTEATGYFYNPKKLELVKHVTLVDENDEFFARGPQIGHFLIKDRESGLKEFSFITFHARADSTKTNLEIDNLAVLFELISQNGTMLGQDLTNFPKNVILGGDLNADGGYLSSSKKDDLIMSIDESFVWLTEDGLDTTVADSSNTYE